ncbi:MAG TPA: type I pullulanase [Caldithrix abyssi]|uniref:pullulanase n=1 Tax=Caldithrix abyssi TaxID=187145 RepID=A0A7V4U3J5_CALAY|nr:type I pullulanase [Caldithrix abyssi]
MYIKKINKFKTFLLIGIFSLLNCAKSPPYVTIHYHRYDNVYTDWTLWTWLDNVQKEIKPQDFDAFGAIYKLNMDDYPPLGNINFLPKYKDWQKKDDPNRAWIRTMPREIWILEGDATVYHFEPSTNPAIRKAFLDADSLLTLVVTHPLQQSEIEAFDPVITLADGRAVRPVEIHLLQAQKKASRLVQLKLAQPLSLKALPATVEANGYSPAYIQLRYVLDKKEFISDVPFGVIIKGDKTSFSVFAPGAKEVTLNLYDKAKDGKVKKYNLESVGNGIWQKELPGNLTGKYYTYTVQHADRQNREQNEIIDPWAKAVTRYNGRGIIVDDHTPVADRPDFPFSEALIYELHVRDFSISEDSGMKHKGKYLAFTERGTHLPGSDLATGVDHLVELGVNTVQLMPVQDFEFDETVSQYFWGYMPVNFNAPEGWYATRRDDDSAVRELKQLVDALHKRGIRVILDVVYNHTSEGNPLIQYNFNGLIPGFFYRQHPDGSYWNGSGCGNELRSEHPMVRRFIVESVKYWAEEYKVDGFRFDLMGLMDLETIRQIVRELHRIDPNIFIYGEPWTAGDTPIEPTVKGRQRGEGFSVFNDHFRDALKGPWYNTEPGYVQKGLNVEAVKKGIMGSIDDFAAQPYESINYVAVHDGRTLWDQLKASTQDDSSITDDLLVAMDKLAAAILFTSQGVPFIHGGQEMLRTKFGSHNSYNEPDSINMIRWQWKKKHYDVFRYYQGLIRLRKEHPMFRMKKAEEIRENLHFLDDAGHSVPDRCIAYRLHKGNSGDSWNEVLVLINPNRKAEQFVIPEGSWNVVVNAGQAGTSRIEKREDQKATVEPVSVMVLYR